MSSCEGIEGVIEGVIEDSWQMSSCEAIEGVILYACMLYRRIYAIRIIDYMSIYGNKS
jgi:hypothetical protein